LCVALSDGLQNQNSSPHLDLPHIMIMMDNVAVALNNSDPDKPAPESFGQTTILLVNGTTSWAGYSTINPRGHSSRNRIPHQFSFKLKTADNKKTEASLLGLASNKKFVLNAMTGDSSASRNWFAFNLLRDMGGVAPAMRYVAVSLFDQKTKALVSKDYDHALYLLTESISKELCDLDTFSNTSLMKNVIFAADKSSYDTVKLPPSRYQLNYPDNGTKADEIERSAIPVLGQHIKDVMERNTFNGAPDYTNMHVPSFVDFLLLQELTNNCDGYYFSTYYHIGRDGIFNAGPAWDMDITNGHPRTQDKTNKDTWQIKHKLDGFSNPFNKMVADTYFWKMVQNRFQALKVAGGLFDLQQLLKRITDSSIVTKADVKQEVKNLSERWHWIDSNIMNITHIV